MWELQDFIFEVRLNFIERKYLRVYEKILSNDRIISD